MSVWCGNSGADVDIGRLGYRIRSREVLVDRDA
jgi:hypothetical protein